MLKARFLALVLTVVGIVLLLDTRAASRTITRSVQAVRFEENVGQVAGDARFVARQRGASVLLDDDAATLSVGGATIEMKVAGARRTRPVASEPLATKTHYLIGDRASWHTDVASFGRVTYHDVLEGVDLVFHGEDGQVEYDLVVAPGVDAAKVAVEIEGSDGLRVDAAGDLIVSTPGGEIVQARPHVFQGDRVVAASYRVSGPKAIAFALGDYDRGQPLVIDPVVVFATYLGVGGLDSAKSLALDSAGNTFVAGVSTLSSAKPGIGTPPIYHGQIPATLEGSDMFVAKLTPAGALSFIAYVGGTGADEATSIALTAAGLPVIAGHTASPNMPISGTPFRGTRGGGQTDGYVAQLSATGSSVLFSSYIDLACTSLGCTPHDDAANAVAVSGTNVVVAGSTAAIAPLTMTTALDGAFVLAFDLASPGSPSYVKYLGGGASASARGIAVDSSGNATVVGQANIGGLTNSVELATQSAVDGAPGTGTNGNAFLAKLNGIGNVQYATYLRGSTSAASDAASGVVLDSTGNAYVVGTTASADFRTAGALQAVAGGGATDAFVAKINPSASGTASLVFATYLGGTGDDSGAAIGLAEDGSIVVTGQTKSPNFPTGSTGTISGPQDAFLAQLGAAGNTLLAGAYFGGAGEEGGLGVAAKGTDVYVAGFTSSTAGVTKSPAQATYGGGPFDAFIGRVTLVLPVPTIAAGAGTDTPPRGELSFAASGTVAPYKFDLAVTMSGGTITEAGAYKAGDKGDVTDVVRVTDGNGSTKTIEVKVGPGVTLNPKTADATPGGTVTFAATGGKGAPFTWSVTPSGTITTAGVLTAPNEERELTVQAEDSLGNKGTATVTVKKAAASNDLAITPASASTHPRGKLTFTVSGGTGPYTWTTPTKSGGTVGFTAANADYTAPATGPSEDTIEVKDSAGNTKTASIKVGNALSVTPASADVAAGGTVKLQIAGGSGTYTVSLATNTSGAKLSPDHVYTAGGVAGTDTVKIADSAGSEVSATFRVSVAGGAAPAPAAAPPADSGGCRAVASGSAGSPWAVSGFALALFVFALRRKRK